MCSGISALKREEGLLALLEAIDSSSIWPVGLRQPCSKLCKEEVVQGCCGCFSRVWI